MSQYMEIGTSIANMIDMANRLRDRGDRLERAMTDAANAIEQHENGAKTFPPDKFTDPFLKTYHSDAEYSQGGQVVSGPANVAIRATAIEMGRQLREIADWVATAMFTYATQNEGNADDIASAPEA
jgi:hypothetical protein